MSEPERPLRGPRWLPTFLREEAGGGMLLIAAAALALLIANGAAASAYRAALATRLGPLDVRGWIDDGLMALFFLGVGLEVKREFAGGALRHARDRPLPLLAAGLGMAVPALLYMLVTRGQPGLARGWAVPAATDIAFAQAVLLIAAPRAPSGLRLLLATIAIVDDVGAVAIIALAYTARIDPAALAAAAALAGVLAVLGRAGVRRLWPYLAVGTALWAAVFLSGVHATVAGVVTAMFVPIRGSGDAPAPLERLEHRLHPWTTYLILPLFGFANAGVDLSGVAGRLGVLPLAIAIALFAGKQAGVGAGMALALRLGLGRRPHGASLLQLYGVAVLAGVGFTMSLFIGGLAFDDPTTFESAKLGVLGGSLLSAALGFAILRFSATRPLSAAPRSP